MLSRTYTAITVGLKPIKIEVEVDGNRGTPNLILIGLPTKAVTESKERITSALINCSIRIRSKRTIVNLAPADIKKSSPTFDLAIVVGLLKMYGEIKGDTDDTIFFGELSLDGELKPMRGALPLVLAAKEMGFQKIVLPEANADEVAIITGIKIYPLKHLKDYLKKRIKKKIPTLKKLKTKTFSATQDNKFNLDFSDINGQETVKRALEITAAGGHNLLMIGPPGAGKSMLAKAMLSILPPLTEQEAIEVTTIHSICGLTQQTGLITQRPLRSPHHTTSRVGLIGGGSPIKPGEISLAHRGILFLDEINEFGRLSLEALRQPLEDGVITIARAAGAATYPAKFSLIGAANPCPCGWHGSMQKRCVCNQRYRSYYQKKLSGPILDRIDLVVSVKAVEIEKLTKENLDQETSQVIRQRVIKARQLQTQTLSHTPYLTNAELTSKEIKKLCLLTLPAKKLLHQAASKLNLSARSYFKTIKVAQTIAQLNEVEEIKKEHLAEALLYRKKF